MREKLLMDYIKNKNRKIEKEILIQHKGYFRYYFGLLFQNKSVKITVDSPVSSVNV